MRIYTKLFDAFRETERDLWEMGIDNHPQSMQDKIVKDDPNYGTREISGYGLKIARRNRVDDEIEEAVSYMFGHQGEAECERVMRYIEVEHKDRMSGKAMNPGNAWKERTHIWSEFMHDGEFEYTYSQRFNEHGQLRTITEELSQRPETRQAIIAMHQGPRELGSLGGTARIPCSMYYQVLVREGRVHLIYTMRSCDLLTHFPIDIILALKMQDHFAMELQLDIGEFTYFCGSLHAYKKDIVPRKVF